MRWSNIQRLDERRPRGCDEVAYRRLLRVARDIRARTGADCWFNKKTGELAFGYDNDGCPRIVQAVPMRRAGRVRSFDPASEQMGPDDIVHAIQIARVSPERKARWQRQWEELRQTEREQAAEEMSTEVGQMAADRYRSKFRTQAVVSGLCA